MDKLDALVLSIFIFAISFATGIYTGSSLTEAHWTKAVLQGKVMITTNNTTTIGVTINNR